MDWLQRAGTILFERMVQKGWNQKQLAAAVGLAPSSITRILHGDQNVTIGTLRDVAQAVDLDLADLFSRTPEYASLAEAQRYAPLLQLRGLVMQLPLCRQGPILEQLIPGLIATLRASSLQAAQESR